MVSASNALTGGDERKKGFFRDTEKALTLPDFVRELEKLSRAEKTAVKRTASNSDANSSNGSSANNLRQLESNQPSDYQNQFTNNVKGKSKLPKNLELNSTKKSIFKNFGPLALITSLVLGGGTIFLLSQNLLGPTINATFTQATDLQFTSYSMRNTRIFQYLMDGGRQIKISNFSKHYTTFTPYMKSRLERNGIQVGYIDSNGAFKTDQLIANSSTVLKYKDEIIDADAFQSKFVQDLGFQEAYYKAKRGRVVGYFDDAAEKYFKKKGQTRDNLNDFKLTGDEEADNKSFRNILNEHVTGVDAKVNTTGRQYDEETGEEKLVHNGDDINVSKIDGDTPEVKARAMVNSLASKVSNVGVPVCSAMRIANMAGAVAASMKTYRSVAFYLGIMESISKSQAGEGEASGINMSLNMLTKQDQTELSYVSEDGTTKTRTEYGSPLDASGAKLIMSGIVSPESDTEYYRIDSLGKTARNVALATGITTTTCSGFMAASAIVALTSTAVPGGALARVVVGAIAQTVGGIAITGIVALIMEAIYPHIVEFFVDSYIEYRYGIPAGHDFVEGAIENGYQMSSQNSAYMPASSDRVKEQNHNTVLAVANEKALDRRGRSPFDLNSTNTFLGSALSKFSYAASSNSLATVLASTAKTVGSSFNSLLPGAYAEDEVNMLTSHYTQCEDAMAGAVCDIYGNPIPASDYSTSNLRPDDPTYQAALAPNLEYDNEGNQIIKKDSELAKFVNFCVNRESPWGYTDANILNALSTDGGIIINNLPILNDVLDVVNFAEDVAYKDWATGKICINSADNPRWDNEFKYYQRYIEDMRILGSMEDYTGGKNPIIAYEDAYEEEHPVDNSLKGTLARISGNTTNDIAFLLEFVEYSTKLANYDPSTRLSFGNEEKTEQKIIFEEKNNNPILAVVKNTENIFIDKRNYSL